MGDILTYLQEIKKAMDLLSKDDRTIFLGQGTVYGDSTLLDVSIDKKIEFPVAEDMQMGVSIGLSLQGYIPITIYPRMDFLILAMNQLINHLDKLETLSNGIFKPKVIIRCVVGAKKPLYPGLQHCQDYTEVLKLCLKNVDVIKLTDSKMILPAYKSAFESGKSTLLIELKELYDTE